MTDLTTMTDDALHSLKASIEAELAARVTERWEASCTCGAVNEFDCLCCPGCYGAPGDGHRCEHPDGCGLLAAPAPTNTYASMVAGITKEDVGAALMANWEEDE